MQTVNIRAAQTTQAYPLGVGSVVTIGAANNVATWSGYFEYTFDPIEKIQANSATWTAWPNGTVSSSTSNTALYPMFARAVCVTGQIQAFFGDSTNSTAINAIPWASTLSLITPSGSLAGSVVPSTT